MSDAVIVKGIKEGLLICVPDTLAWPAAMAQLETKLEEARDFWAGANAIVDIGDGKVEEPQLKRLQEMLMKRYRMQLVAAYANAEAALAAASALGLGTKASIVRRVPEGALVVEAGDQREGNALYIRQTIRSGQVVRYDGTIVICGDANAGSELIAAGDIVVLGTLRGVAHAGAKGDEQARIFAVNLRPTQLRIAAHVARSPDAMEAAPPLSYLPEVAAVRDGKIHISALRERLLNAVP